MSIRAAVLLVVAASLGVNGSVAEESRCPPTEYKYLRYDENYAFLKDPACRTDPLDFLKFIPLTEDGVSYLSLGGEVRETVEYFENPTWGQEPQGPVYFLQRYMAHADFHMGSRTRFFLQLKSGLENEREGGPRPFDEDQLDLNQAFLDVALVTEPEHSLSLRVGRQEMAYGATRWISAREGPTVHQTFEGVKLIFQSRAWRVDAFGTRFVRTKPGTFDDDPEPGRDLWGVYAVHPVSFLPEGHVDLYYLGAHRDLSRYNQGAGEETRHSVGTRLWGKHEAWDYDLEPIVQWGSFAQGDIRAWAVETDTGYTLRSVRATPRIGFKVHAASGDQDPTDPDLETFNPLYPRGLYNQLVNLYGHVNLIELQPSVTIRPTKRWTITLDWSLVERQSVDDGVYSVGGSLLRPAGSSRARSIGEQVSLVPIWRLNRHVTFVWIATHFFPGRFLEETGPAEPVTHLSGWFAYKF